MEKPCCFCKTIVTCPPGIVDIGGLKLCIPCYKTRSVRTELSCEVCGKLVEITPDPLITHVCCLECERKADLSGAYARSYKDKETSPCDKCGEVAPPYHATVYGQALCHNCYNKAGRPCTQLYSGDKGYPPYFPSMENRKPSIPVLILPFGNSHRSCVVCFAGLSDPKELVPQFKLPTICEKCEGPAWWEVRQKL